MKNRIILAMLLAGVSAPAISADFGVSADQLLESQSLPLFGISKPLSRFCTGKRRKRLSHPRLH